MPAYGAATAGAGSLIGLVGGLLKKRVRAPEYKPVVPGDEARKAIEANIANLPQAENLIGQTNQFNQQQLLSNLRASIPGFDQLTGQTSQQITNLLSGILPPDVREQINRSAAEQAVSMGTSGSQFGGNRAARDIGLSSLNLITQGLQESNRWLANAAQNFTSQPIGVQSMFITPAMQIESQFRNTENQYNRDWLSNQLTAAQATRTLVGNSLEQFGSSLTGVGGIGMGSGGGGGGMTSAVPTSGSYLNYLGAQGAARGV